MSDYIKREDAVKSIQKHDLANDCNGSKEWAEWLLEDVKSSDVVEVVRCKDCKNWGGDELAGYCKKFSLLSDPNDFCSSGKRKEQDDER